MIGRRRTTTKANLHKDCPPRSSFAEGFLTIKVRAIIKIVSSQGQHRAQKIMVFFMQQGDRYRMTPISAPNGLVSAKGFYLEIVKDFKVPPKLYGNTVANADRILTTTFIWIDHPPQGVSYCLVNKRDPVKNIASQKSLFRPMAAENEHTRQSL